MRSYVANAHRDRDWLVVDGEGVGVTQGRNLLEARDMAADLVVTMLEVERHEV